MSVTQTGIRIGESEFIIELPDRSAIGRVEILFDQFFATRIESESLPELIISFAKVEWIDVPTLVFLISITYKRHIGNGTTRFRLPENDNRRKADILIFLHTWRFFEVLEEVTKVPFQEYLINPHAFDTIIRFFPADESGVPTGKGFAETPLYVNLAKDYFRKFYEDDEGLKSLHFDKKFFPLISEPFKTDRDKSKTLSKTIGLWDKKSLIVSVLEQHINGRKVISDENANLTVETINQISIQNTLANDVIKESFTNAIRHPYADLLVTGSYFDKVGKHFTIVIWDNGKSIVQSLRKGLEKYGTIKNQSFQNEENVLNPSYFLTDGSEDPQNLDDIDVDKKLFFSTDAPTQEDPDWKFLLASFYPGVTSEPSAAAQDEKGELKQPKLDFGDRIGMGLTVLLDSIIKVFEGSVLIRIDDQVIAIKRIETQFLNTIYRKKKDKIYIQPLWKRYEKDKIDPANLKATNVVYQVKILSKTKNPLFCGNMLTIRIPLT